MIPVVTISLLFHNSISGIDTKDIRIISRRVISADLIGFVYAEDMWVANLHGLHAFPNGKSMACTSLTAHYFQCSSHFMGK